MLKIEFEKTTGEQQASIFSPEDFTFTSVSPNAQGMIEIIAPFADRKNLVLIGRGGSVSTFRALWEAKGRVISQKNVFILDTVDPDYTALVKERTAPSDTLVITISKSGNTVDVLENFFCFSAYQQIVVTNQKEDNPLLKAALAAQTPVLVHPEVGGRFSGLTEVGLLPAYFVGFDIEAIREGGLKAYGELASSGSQAELLADKIVTLNTKGYDQIYLAIYSEFLFGFAELIQQLIHESACKNGKGLSILPVEAPESQHHSNQRLFGGPKNMIAFFISIGSFDNDETATIPEEISESTLRDGRMADLGAISLKKSMRAELLGNLEEAKSRNIPNVLIEMDNTEELALGYFIAFWQILAIFIARALDVNPFDQPEVEGAKTRSFAARKTS